MVANHRILITGASGFVGRHILDRARVEGYDAIAAYRGALAPGSIHVDVCDPKSVDAAFRITAPSIVIHCAAYGVNYADQDPDQALAVNVLGALSVLKTAARYGVTRFVHIGSCFEYGSHKDPISEDSPLNPTAVYGATKAAASILLGERAHSLGVPMTIVRPFGIWGPGEPAHRLLPQVIAACMNRSPLELTPCEVVRDYSYVEDLAEIILSLSTLSDVGTGTVVNVGTGEPVALRDFVRSFAKALGGEEYMQFGALPYRPTEMPSLVADVKRMHQLLGRVPRTPLSEGVRRMLRGMPQFAQVSAEIESQLDDHCGT